MDVEIKLYLPISLAVQNGLPYCGRIGYAPTEEEWKVLSKEERQDIVRYVDGDDRLVVDGGGWNDIVRSYRTWRNKQRELIERLNARPGKRKVSTPTEALAEVAQDAAYHLSNRLHRAVIIHKPGHPLSKGMSMKARSNVDDVRAELREKVRVMSSEWLFPPTWIDVVRVTNHLEHSDHYYTAVRVTFELQDAATMILLVHAEDRDEP